MTWKRWLALTAALWFAPLALGQSAGAPVQVGGDGPAAEGSGVGAEIVDTLVEPDDELVGDEPPEVDEPTADTGEPKPAPMAEGLILEVPDEGVSIANLPYPDRLGGEWYLPSLTCTFCSGLLGQTVQVDKADTVVQYYDRAILVPDAKNGTLVLRSEKELLDLQLLWKDGALILLFFDQGDMPRVGESFARMWVLKPTANDKLLYGRAYTVYAFTDDAFSDDPEQGRWKANTSYFGADRLLALLEDVRVRTLTEDRRLYVPSNEVRVSYEGAQALFRLDLTVQDLADGEAADLKAVRARAERVALFRTLVAGGDELYARGEYEKALAQYGAANSVREGESVVYANMGAAYQMQRKYVEADRSYRIAADLAPGDLDIVFNLAVVSEAQGQWVRARDLYRTVAAARPDDLDVQERLAVVEPQARRIEQSR